VFAEELEQAFKIIAALPGASTLISITRSTTFRC